MSPTVLKDEETSVQVAGRRGVHQRASKWKLRSLEKNNFFKIYFISNQNLQFYELKK
jgi:hypothetical protein